MSFSSKFKLHDVNPVEPYEVDHLIEVSYRIPHVCPFVVPSNLSFQPLPAPKSPHLKTLEEKPYLIKPTNTAKVNGAQIEAVLQAKSRFSDPPVDGFNRGFTLGIIQALKKPGHWCF
ncbi:unnamed protein product [Orchesella dallaii]|uniref:Uncharacterized protein n=1 Tax=Orchesella dallaii TaxID=48710 RepID=A0ABP1RP20_9HEXA